MPRPPSKILIVDDQQVFIDPLLEILTPRYRTSVALSGKQALHQACSDDPPDLILLDVLMPEMDGHEVCRRLKQCERTREIPVIFVTDQRDVNDEAQGLRLGAVDFITKPISPPIVMARIETHLALRDARDALERCNEWLEEKVRERTAELGREISERRKAEAQLRRLANYDPLTGLPNRILLKDRLAQELKHARRDGTIVALLLVDLDRFKQINDTLGHYYGDRLLQQVARRLRRCVRDVDTVARLGGDEFTITLVGLATRQDAAVVAGKILAESREPFFLGTHTVRVSASIGITGFPEDGDDIDTMMKNADLAMYRAKTQGKNGYAFYTACMSSRVRERTRTEHALRRAVAMQQLVLHHQPIVALGSGAVVGTEALLRWRRPGQGLVLPGEFVPVADASGLTLSIGEWVLRTACEQANRWRGRNWPEFRLAVNCSARQFNDNHRLLSIVEQLLAECRFPPGQLSLEITEGLLLDATRETIDNLEGLATLGIKLTVDDFGKGVASLGIMRRFPIDTIKIDRSLIRDIETDAGAADYVAGILAMARCLRLAVVAEGVETESQASFLQTHGCDFAQGYRFGKPAPAETLELAPAGGQ